MRVFIALAGLALAGCATQLLMRETLLSGQTMGSAWTVKVAGHLPASAEELRDGVQGRFDAVNLALSTYRTDSALSHFNNDDSGQWVDIDAELGEVLSYALSLRRDGGAAGESLGLRSRSGVVASAGRGGDRERSRAGRLAQG
jgi:thiamine biosynthesis lipoprotein